MGDRGLPVETNVRRVNQASMLQRFEPLLQELDPSQLAANMLYLSQQDGQSYAAVSGRLRLAALLERHPVYEARQRAGNAIVGTRDPADSSPEVQTATPLEARATADSAAPPTQPPGELLAAALEVLRQNRDLLILNMRDSEHHSANVSLINFIRASDAHFAANPGEVGVFEGADHQEMHDWEISTMIHLQGYNVSVTELIEESSESDAAPEASPPAPGEVGVEEGIDPSRTLPSESAPHVHHDPALDSPDPSNVDDSLQGS
jgi:hypothetical protein